MSRILKMDKPNVGKIVEQMELYCNFNLGYLPKRIKIYVHKKTYLRKFTVVLFRIAKTGIV